MKGLLFVSIPVYDRGPEALNLYFFYSVYFSFMNNAFIVVFNNLVSNPMLSRFSPIFSFLL